MSSASSVTTTWYPLWVSQNASAGPAIPAPLIRTIGFAMGLSLGQRFQWVRSCAQGANRGIGARLSRRILVYSRLSLGSGPMVG